MVTILSLFINKLTTPRTLSNDELLINGLFLFDTPKEISDFEFFSSDGNRDNDALSKVFSEVNVSDSSWLNELFIDLKIKKN